MFDERASIGDDDASGVDGGVSVETFESAGDIPKSLARRGFSLISSRRRGSCWRASSKVISRTLGMSLARRLVSLKEMSIARPTSFKTALALSFPKVMIWETAGPPGTAYRSRTYWITSSRRASQKLTSISGMETRSGLRKRSKSRLCLIGSMSVMRVQKATREPAADPDVPGRRGYRVFSAGVDKVRDDQEIVGKAHFLDHLEFVFEAIEVFFAQIVVFFGRVLGEQP